MPFPYCSNLEAYLDMQPPGPASLHAFATFVFPTTGYNVKLIRMVPQGINPYDLLLYAHVIPPTGPALDVLTEVHARYDEDPALLNYTTVTITNSGKTTNVKIIV